MFITGAASFRAMLCSTPWDIKHERSCDSKTSCKCNHPDVLINQQSSSRCVHQAAIIQSYIHGSNFSISDLVYLQPFGPLAIYSGFSLGQSGAMHSLADRRLPKRIHVSDDADVKSLQHAIENILRFRKTKDLVAFLKVALPFIIPCVF